MSRSDLNSLDIMKKLTPVDQTPADLTYNYYLKARRMSRRYSRSPPRREYSPRRSPRREPKRGPPDITDMVFNIYSLYPQLHDLYFEICFKSFSLVERRYLDRRFQ